MQQFTILLKLVLFERFISTATCDIIIGFDFCFLKYCKRNKNLSIKEELLLTLVSYVSPNDTLCIR